MQEFGVWAIRRDPYDAWLAADSISEDEPLPLEHRFGRPSPFA